MYTAADPTFARWRDELAATGLYDVGVEFRADVTDFGPLPCSHRFRTDRDG